MVNIVLRCCISTVKYIPVVFITAILMWSYYAYVIQLCFLSYIIVFHVLFVMLVWSYIKTIFTKPAQPSIQFYLSSADVQKYKSAGLDRQQMMIKRGVGDLPVSSPRFCQKCYCYKPDRAHHCSTCGMVNNCVNFANYKFFVLFLGYALLYCLWIGVSSLQYFIMFWRDMTDNSASRTTMQIVFLTLVGFMFSVSVVSLLGYHIYLVSKNKSTLEAFQVPTFRNGLKDKRAYDLGCKPNFVQIFGQRYLSALLPIHTSQGDGERFQMTATAMVIATASYQSMETAQISDITCVQQNTVEPAKIADVAAVNANSNNSAGDGQTYPLRSVNEVGRGLLRVDKDTSDSDDDK